MENKIYTEVVSILNQKNFNKKSLSEITKDQLKEIFRDVYAKYKSLGGIEKSKKDIWREAAKEVINEEKNKNKEDEKSLKNDEDTKNKDKEVQKNDNNENEDYKNEDYDDDLIQPEFPQKYCEAHETKIEQLSKKLEEQRKKEDELRKEYFRRIEDLMENYKKKDNQDTNTKDNSKEKNQNQQKLEDPKTILERSINEEKNELKKKI